MRAPAFPAESRTVGRGSALGPFTGQVLDADSRQPIAGAVVSAVWHFQRGVGNAGPEANRVTETTTDVDGRYEVLSLRDLPVGLSTRLARFSFVVYKKGYVAYRHDRVFGSGRRHRDFAQREAVVRLVRWSPELSHARHLLFMGGAPKVREASAWEVLAAASELDGKQARQAGALSAGSGALAEGAAEEATPNALDAGKLISSDEVRAITGYTGAFTEGRLKDPRSEAQDSYHFRAVDRAERYDVAIRLWRAGGDTITTRYEEMLAALPGSKQTDEVGDRSFSVTQGEILGVGFMDRATSAIVLITCGRGQCTEPSMALKLAEKIQEHLDRLPAPPATAAPTEPDGATPEQTPEVPAEPAGEEDED